MTTRMLRVGLVLAAVLALVGCAPSEATAVDPHWGKQPCGHCAMLLSTPRYAAQGVRATGERLYFDDVGCLVAWERDHREPLKRAWARDEKGAWTPVMSARFMAGEATPMDFGFAAVSGTEGVSYAEVAKRVVARLESQENDAP